MFRCPSFKNIASIAKTLEFFFAVMFLFRSISCSSVYFPAAVELGGFLFRRLCMILVSHRFMFFLGNLIVITLFVKSGGSNRCGTSDSGNSNDEEDYLIGQFVPPNEMVSCEIVASEETVPNEKHTVPTEIEGRSDSGRGNPSPEMRRRARSEDFKAEVTEKFQLRRSETEAGLKMERSSEESTGRRTTVEDLSNEEFQRKVEAFIERQQRFLREESSSMVNRYCFSA
ncbi:hypothetical protein V2J09_019779 [Rumex salicifolius]